MHAAACYACCCTLCMLLASQQASSCPAGRPAGAWSSPHGRWSGRCLADHQPGAAAPHPPPPRRADSPPLQPIARAPPSHLPRPIAPWRPSLHHAARAPPAPTSPAASRGRRGARMHGEGLGERRMGMGRSAAPRGCGRGGLVHREGACAGSPRAAQARGSLVERSTRRGRGADGRGRPGEDSLLPWRDRGKDACGAGDMMLHFPPRVLAAQAAGSTTLAAARARAAPHARERCRKRCCCTRASLLLHAPPRPC
jgi:hypothetical protein